MLPILEPPSLQRWGTLTSLSEALFLKEKWTETSDGLVTAPSAAGTSAYDRAEKPARVRFPQPTSVAIVATTTLAAVSATLALSWHWIAPADLVSALYVLSCTLVMVRCMKGKGHGQQVETGPTTDDR
jgi:hypothetical protein